MPCNDHHFLPRPSPPATGEVRGVSTSGYPNACFHREHFSYSDTPFFLLCLFCHRIHFSFLKTIDTLPPSIFLPLLSCDVSETLWGSYKHQRLLSQKLGFSCFTCSLSALVLQPGKKPQTTPCTGTQTDWIVPTGQDINSTLHYQAHKAQICSGFNGFWTPRGPVWLTENLMCLVHMSSLLFPFLLLCPLVCLPLLKH